MTEPGRSWPPPLEEQSPVLVPEDGTGEALHQGWRLLILGLCCAPPVFLPLAAWQGITASRRRSGAGTPLLLTVGGVGLLWVGAVLVAVHFGTGK